MVAALERMRVWTAADLLAMSDDPDCRYELVEGRLMRMSPTGGIHGRRGALPNKCLMPEKLGVCPKSLTEAARILCLAAMPVPIL